MGNWAGIWWGLERHSFRKGGGLQYPPMDRVLQNILLQKEHQDSLGYRRMGRILGHGIGRYGKTLFEVQIPLVRSLRYPVAIIGQLSMRSMNELLMSQNIERM